MPTIFPTDVAELYRQQYELINQYGLINLAMPMFVFISGFLFGRQLKRKPLSLVKACRGNRFTAGLTGICGFSLCYFGVLLLHI